MLLFVLLAVSLAFLIWLTYLLWRYDPYAFIESIPGKIFATLGLWGVGGFVGLLISTLVSVGLAQTFTPDYAPGDTDSTGLRATTAKDVTEGEFHGGIFASYGYIDGKRVISYVTEGAQGDIRLGYVDASQSVLFEDSNTDPRLETHHWYKENWFFLPGVFDTAETYSLYVPEGTVVDGYEIKP